MCSAKIDSSETEFVTLVSSFLKQIEVSCNGSGKVSKQDFEKIISSNFQMTSNGAEICKNLDQFIRLLNDIKMKWKHFIITPPFEEPSVCGNKVSINYEGIFTKKDEEKDIFFIMALGTVEEGKIRKWTQVAHEKGKDDVYS